MCYGVGCKILEKRRFMKATPVTSSRHLDVYFIPAEIQAWLPVIATRLQPGQGHESRGADPFVSSQGEGPGGARSLHESPNLYSCPVLVWLLKLRRSTTGGTNGREMACQQARSTTESTYNRFHPCHATVLDQAKAALACLTSISSRRMICSCLEACRDERRILSVILPIHCSVPNYGTPPG